MNKPNEKIEKIERLAELTESFKSIVIGAGAGLSTAAGFDCGGKRFLSYFADFYRKYGITDMYSGGFFPFESLEEHWAYWSRYIYINRYKDSPKPTYELLLSLVKNKDYFVITTNVDHLFQKAGFDKKRLFYTQGDYGLLQCQTPCHIKTYDNEKIITEMVNRQKNMKIPSDLIPYCPKCGKPMTLNLRSDDTFAEDEGWRRAYKNYCDFISARKNGKILFLELGVGYNTPVIIKYPFWQMTAENKNAFYVSVNKENYAPDSIKSRSLLINGDIYNVLESLSKKEVLKNDKGKPA